MVLLTLSLMTNNSKKRCQNMSETLWKQNNKTNKNTHRTRSDKNGNTA